jgi:hypothetical protein
MYLGCATAVQEITITRTGASFLSMLASIYTTYLY